MDERLRQGHVSRVRLLGPGSALQRQAVAEAHENSVGPDAGQDDFETYQGQEVDLPPAEEVAWTFDELSDARLVALTLTPSWPQASTREQQLQLRWPLEYRQRAARVSVLLDDLHKAQQAEPSTRKLKKEPLSLETLPQGPSAAAPAPTPAGAFGSQAASQEVSAVADAAPDPSQPVTRQRRIHQAAAAGASAPSAARSARPSAEAAGTSAAAAIDVVAPTSSPKRPRLGLHSSPSRAAARTRSQAALGPETDSSGLPKAQGLAWRCTAASKGPLPQHATNDGAGAGRRLRQRGGLAPFPQRPRSTRGAAAAATALANFQLLHLADLFEANAGGVPEPVSHPDPSCGIETDGVAVNAEEPAAGASAADAATVHESGGSGGARPGEPSKPRGRQRAMQPPAHGAWRCINRWTDNTGQVVACGRMNRGEACVACKAPRWDGEAGQLAMRVAAVLQTEDWRSATLRHVIGRLGAEGTVLPQGALPVPKAAVKEQVQRFLDLRAQQQQAPHPGVAPSGAAPAGLIAFDEDPAAADECEAYEEALFEGASRPTASEAAHPAGIAVRAGPSVEDASWRLKLALLRLVEEQQVLAAGRRQPPAPAPLAHQDPAAQSQPAGQPAAGLLPFVAYEPDAQPTADDMAADAAHPACEQPAGSAGEGAVQHHAPAADCRGGAAAESDGSAGAKETAEPLGALLEEPRARRMAAQRGANFAQALVEALLARVPRAARTSKYRLPEKPWQIRDRLSLKLGLQPSLPQQAAAAPLPSRPSRFLAGPFRGQAMPLPAAAKTAKHVVEMSPKPPTATSAAADLPRCKEVGATAAAGPAPSPERTPLPHAPVDPSTVHPRTAKPSAIRLCPQPVGRQPVPPPGACRPQLGSLPIERLQHLLLRAALGEEGTVPPVGGGSSEGRATEEMMQSAARPIGGGSTFSDTAPFAGNTNSASSQRPAATHGAFACTSAFTPVKAPPVAAGEAQPKSTGVQVTQSANIRLMELIKAAKRSAAAVPGLGEMQRDVQLVFEVAAQLGVRQQALDAAAKQLMDMHTKSDSQRL